MNLLQPSEETYVGMQLGMLEPFTINVSSVEITQTVGEDVYTDVTQILNTMLT